jgi:hypothetical protein
VVNNVICELVCSYVFTKSHPCPMTWPCVHLQATVRRMLSTVDNGSARSLAGTGNSPTASKPSVTLAAPDSAHADPTHAAVTSPITKVLYRPTCQFFYQPAGNRPHKCTRFKTHTTLTITAHTEPTGDGVPIALSETRLYWPARGTLSRHDHILCSPHPLIKILGHATTG